MIRKVKLMFFKPLRGTQSEYQLSEMQFYQHSFRRASRGGIPSFVFLLSFLILNVLSGQQDLIGRNYKFQPGQEVRLFGDNVNLRKAPTVSSDILSTLPLNTSLKILDVSKEELTLAGLKQSWYKVEANDNVGYVWGGLISQNSLWYGDRYFLIGLIVEDENLKSVIKVIENETIIHNEKVDLLTFSFSTNLIADNIHLDRIENIYVIDYSSEACGVNGGKTLLLFDGESFCQKVDLDEIGDADLYSISEELLLPNGSYPEANNLIFTIENSKKIKSGLYKSEKIEALLKWDGQKFSPSLDSIKSILNTEFGKLD